MTEIVKEQVEVHQKLLDFNMGINKHRNKPCYCRSGKKFKKCHLLILEECRQKGINPNSEDLPYEIAPAMTVEEVKIAEQKIWERSIKLSKNT